MPQSLSEGLGVGSPPFRVRDASEINQKLGRDALPYGFTAVPVMSFDQGNRVGDFRTFGCPRADVSYFANEADPETFTPHSDLFERTRLPISKALGLSGEEVNKLNYLALANYSDTILSFVFQGVISEDVLSEAETEDLH